MATSLLYLAQACVAKWSRMTLNCKSLMCVSVRRPAGLGNRWRFRASSADAGVSKPSQGATSLGGRVPLLTGAQAAGLM